MDPIYHLNLNKIKKFQLKIHLAIHQTNQYLFNL